MDRKEAIEILKKNKPTNDPRRCGTELCEAVDMAIEALQEPERKKGRWTTDLRCSACDYPVEYHGGRTDFCPNCGADMRGEKE